MKISDIFIVKTGQRIIEEDVYFHKGDFPCITSQTTDEGITWYADRSWLEKEHGQYIIDVKECITWTKDGAKCGTMFYRDYAFYPNDHCGVLIPREEYKDELNLKWFIYAYQNYIKNFVMQQGSQGMLYNAEMGEIDIEFPFPDKETIQDRVVEQYARAAYLRKQLKKEIGKLEKLLQYELQFERNVEYKMENIALLNKGSNKISEEMIYLNYDMNGIPVYSSATENQGLMGRVTRACFETFDKKGKKGDLTWTTNGYAGVVFYRNSDFLYSEKCGRIVIRKEFREKIFPQYLMYILNQITYKHKTAESNNSKLDIIHMANIPICFPADENGNIDVDTEMQVVKIYQLIENLKEKLESIEKKLADL